jgi:Integrase core domain
MPANDRGGREVNDDHKIALEDPVVLRDQVVPESRARRPTASSSGSSAPLSTSTSTADPIKDGDALAVEVNRFRQIYNTIRPHQALHDRTPRDAYLAGR